MVPTRHRVFWGEFVCREWKDDNQRVQCFSVFSQERKVARGTWPPAPQFQPCYENGPSKIWLYEGQFVQKPKRTHKTENFCTNGTKQISEQFEGLRSLPSKTSILRLVYVFLFVVIVSSLRFLLLLLLLHTLPFCCGLGFGRLGGTQRAPPQLFLAGFASSWCVCIFSFWTRLFLSVFFFLFACLWLLSCCCFCSNQNTNNLHLLVSGSWLFLLDCFNLYFAAFLTLFLFTSLSKIILWLCFVLDTTSMFKTRVAFFSRVCYVFLFHHFCFFHARPLSSTSLLSSPSCFHFGFFLWSGLVASLLLSCFETRLSVYFFSQIVLSKLSTVSVLLVALLGLVTCACPTKLLNM